MKLIPIISFLILNNAYAAYTKYEKIINQVCEEQKIDCILFKSVLKVESNFDLAAFNAKSHDHGIGQINRVTASAMKLDINRLKTDLHYSLTSSALVLKWFFVKYSTKEADTWICRYNVGTAKLVGARKFKCRSYLRKIALAKLEFLNYNSIYAIADKRD